MSAAVAHGCLFAFEIVDGFASRPDKRRDRAMDATGYEPSAFHAQHELSPRDGAPPLAPGSIQVFGLTKQLAFGSVQQVISVQLDLCIQLKIERSEVSVLENRELGFVS